MEPSRVDVGNSISISRANVVKSPLELRLRRNRWFAWIARVQGVFYLITGVWPLVHMRSFLFVTGPKTDLWLVQTVGAILAVIGYALWRSGLRRTVTTEMVIVAAGCAAALAVVDIVFVNKRVIGPIYLLDAAAEIILVIGWLICAAMNRSGRIIVRL
jgi:hypothetical protein